MSSDSLAKPRWWEHSVIYEIYVRSFQDSNGDGIGDLPGIIQRLDYLRNDTSDSLGIDAIWLTPIYPSPLYDYGYDVSDYTGIDPAYGSLDDFDRLAREAEQHEIKIVLDFVLNHSSHMHPWFLESRSNKQSDRRDWYVWKDPTPEGGPPNNWQSVFGGPAWTLDEPTGQYYLHSFLPQQPDLNWRNPSLRKAMHDVVRFWIQRGVSGFRLDATAFIGKDAQLRDNLAVAPTSGTSGLGVSYPLRNMNHPDMHDWLRELRHVVDEDGIERFLVSEIYDLDDDAIALLHGSEGPEMSMSFNFELIGCSWHAESYRNAVESFSDSLPSGATPNTALNNHDQSRSISRFGADGCGRERARLVAMLQFALPGAVFIYYGEEIGMLDGVIPPDRIRDPVGLRSLDKALNPGRDPERTPMQWSSGLGAGFTTGEAWLPLGSTAQEINVELECRVPESMLTLYRSLISLRTTQQALRVGQYRAFDDVPDNVYLFERDSGSQTVLVALNFASEPRKVPIQSWKSAVVLACTHVRQERERIEGAISLRPLEGVILEHSS